MGTKAIALKNLKKSHREAAKRLVKIIPAVMRDYRKMTAKHIEHSYIVQTLSEKYGVSTRSIYRYIHH